MTMIVAVADVDPDLAKTLTDLAEGRTCVDSKRLRGYIKERINEAESAAQFSRAVDAAAREERQAGAAKPVEDVTGARRKGRSPLEAPARQQTCAIVRTADQPTIHVDLTPEGIAARHSCGIEEVRPFRRYAVVRL